MISKGLRSIDMFGSRVSLSHNGATNFKTIFGGILTIIAIGLMGFFIFIMVTHPVELTTVTNTNTNTNTNSTATTNSSKFKN